MMIWKEKKSQLYIFIFYNSFYDFFYLVYLGFQAVEEMSVCYARVVFPLG